MNLDFVKAQFFGNIKNIPGPCVNRKILVIECDDWGSIRMPSLVVFEKLLASGFDLNNRFDKFDTLADVNDLTELFSILESTKDKNGHSAVITPFVNVANPDFEKIKSSGFQELFFEPFTKTLERYGRSIDTMKVWKQGIENGIFMPEYHGNSHITTLLWLDKLHQGDSKLFEAFNHGFVSAKIPGVNPAARGFRPELFFENDSQISILENGLKDGVHKFNEIFGFIPSVFAPTNGIFHPAFEKALFDQGLKYLYVSWLTLKPDGQGGLKRKFFHLGSKGKSGLTYYARNCAFEPTDNGYISIEKTMKQISAAFKWDKPAIISTHRVNFIGAISKPNRENGLGELNKLLTAVKKQWPDVEFMSSV
jgi:hypothetical protein